MLEALGKDLRARTVESVVVFLGDNIYPRGMPEPGDPNRAEAERRLLAQIQTVQRAGAKGYFVLGNHDWARHGVDGWNAALRQERYIDSVGKGYAVLKPGGGCPGPSTADIGPRVRLLLLEMAWIALAVAVTAFLLARTGPGAAIRTGATGLAARLRERSGIRRGPVSTFVATYRNGVRGAVRRSDRDLPAARAEERHLLHAHARRGRAHHLGRR